MKKTQFFWFVLIAILAVAAVLRLTSRRGEWSCQDGEWIKRGNPSASRPTSSCPHSFSESSSSSSSPSALLGGDRDEHGCLPSAGYSWCEAKDKCLRVWEESCEAAAAGSILAEASVSDPQPGQLVASPLVVQGQAKGNWFFEAKIPVRLTDAENKEIATIGGQAQGEWMTEGMVPFTATLEFATKATSGYLIIAKDNPSGLPSNEASISIPVRFK